MQVLVASKTSFKKFIQFKEYAFHKLGIWIMYALSGNINMIFGKIALSTKGIFRIKQKTGMPIIVIQTCQIEQLLKKSQAFSIFYQSYKLLASNPHNISIRDAIFGK